MKRAIVAGAVAAIVAVVGGVALFTSQPNERIKPPPPPPPTFTPTSTPTRSGPVPPFKGTWIDEPTREEFEIVQTGDTFTITQIGVPLPDIGRGKGTRTGDNVEFDYTTSKGGISCYGEADADAGGSHIGTYCDGFAGMRQFDLYQTHS